MAASYLSSSFSFNLLVREAADASVTQSCKISCRDTPVSSLFIRADSVPDFRYTYGDSSDSVKMAFQVSTQSQSYSEHPDCSETDIYYDYSVESSVEGLDTSFIVVDRNTVSWFRETNQASATFTVSISATINLTTLGLVKTKTQSFKLTCSSICS